MVLPAEESRPTGPMAGRSRGRMGMATASAVKESKSARKVIITCAVTGSVHTPTMTPYLPITPDQIARESIDAAEAGASVIHLHARDPKAFSHSCCHLSIFSVTWKIPKFIEPMLSEQSSGLARR